MTAQKILLADDSVTIRKVVELTFADEGIDVISVADGDAAMLKFSEDRPDMVIADVNMPGMNGYEICESIKSNEATRHVPVILLVGSFEPFDPGEASRVGANYYFTKPFHSIRELVEKVTEYLAVGATTSTVLPETEDIESLYNQSFQDTLEMPESDKKAETDTAGQIRTDDPAYHPFDTAERPDRNHGADGEIREFGQSADREQTHGSVESYEDITPPTDPENLNMLNRSEVRYEGGVAVAPELGDSGMDDDIIETIHPHVDSNDSVAPRLDTLSPFDEPASTAPLQIETQKDTALGNFDWKEDDLSSEEARQNDVEETNALKFLIEDEPPPPTEPQEIYGGKQRPPENFDSAEPVATDNISPELIEIIVGKVVERLSEKAVREAAQEAVPRIAEKLIREALEEDNRK